MTTMLIIGASSAIATAIAVKAMEDDGVTTLIRVSRSTLPPLPHSDKADKKILDWHCNYSEQDIERCCQEIASAVDNIDSVFICNGVLHGTIEGIDDFLDFSPEKKLEDIHLKAMHHVIQSNALLPILWLQSLIPVFARNQYCKVVCFSARVGSIKDNRLGGWYSYRASKAALNMLLKTASVEFARRFKKVKLIAFHPGTTDTELSKPFQANVPEGKLFTPEFVATQLFQIVAVSEFDGQLSYLDWNHQSIEF